MFGVDAVKDRLESFGYKVKTEDKFVLTFCVEKVWNTIKNETNQYEVPEELEYIAINMATGEFLLAKKTFAPKEIEFINLDYVEKQIQVGDTNITFAIGEGCNTPEQRLDTIIHYLLSYGKTEFAAFRRIKW